MELREIPDIDPTDLGPGRHGGIGCETVRYLMFMDIDGTLVGKDLRVADDDRRAIDEMRRAGCRAFVATGRKYSSAVEVAKSFDPPLGVVASNGCVFEVEGRLSESHFDADAFVCTCEVIRECGSDGFFFGLDRTYYVNEPPTYMSPTDLARIEAGEEPLIEKIGNAHHARECCRAVVNGIVISDDRAVLDRTRAALADIEGLDLSSSLWNNIEITPSGIDKASAIRRIQAIFGLSENETLAFGDGMNDVGMFECARYSVAMGNAPEDVRRLARYVTATSEEAGIADFLNRFRSGELD